MDKSAVELSDIISIAFDARSNSDYDDFYVISKEEVEEQIDNAIQFCDVVGEYLKTRYVGYLYQ